MPPKKHIILRLFCLPLAASAWRHTFSIQIMLSTTHVIKGQKYFAIESLTSWGVCHLCFHSHSSAYKFKLWCFYNTSASQKHAHHLLSTLFYPTPTIFLTVVHLTCIRWGTSERQSGQPNLNGKGYSYSSFRI
jgi:hypothetical protein